MVPFKSHKESMESINSLQRKHNMVSSGLSSKLNSYWSYEIMEPKQQRVSKMAHDFHEIKNGFKASFMAKKSQQAVVKLIKQQEHSKPIISFEQSQTSPYVTNPDSPNVLSPIKLQSSGMSPKANPDAIGKMSLDNTA